MNPNDPYYTLKDVADLLALMHEVDETVPALSSGTLGYYVLDTEHCRMPKLKSILMGKTRLILHSDAMAWLKEYKAAPKLGRRGDGSKQPKSKRKSVTHVEQKESDK